jgi:hypothetical protein
VQKRFSCKNDFEAVYLRHAMVKRITQPVSEQELKKYSPIVARTAVLFFNKFHTNFTKISMELEDVTSIANVYAYTFLSTYNTEAYFDQYREFDKATVDRKHRNNLIKFLRHKLNYLNKVAGAKSTGILGEKNTVFYLELPEGKFYNLPMNTSLSEYKKLGFKKVTKTRYKNKKPTDRFVQITQANHGFLSIEESVLRDKGKVENSATNFVSGADLFGSDQTLYSNDNPYTSSTEDLLIAQEQEVDIHKKMNNPDFIKRVLKTNIRYNRKMYKMLKDRLKELESLGSIDV